MTTLEQVQKSVLLLLSRLLIAAGSRAAALDSIRPLDATSQTSGSLISSLVQLYEAEVATDQAGSDLGSTLLRVISMLVCWRAHAIESPMTIEGLAIPLEPTSQLVRRMARIGSCHLSRFLLGTNARERIQRTSRGSLQETASSGASLRSAKRFKAHNGATTSFETDTIFSGLSGSAAALALGVPRGVALEEAARTLASLDLLTAVFPQLTCQLTSEMTDLATTTAALTVATIEALFASGIKFTPKGMEASLGVAALHLLDTVLHHSNGTTLAMVSTRARPLLQATAVSVCSCGGQVAEAMVACQKTLQTLAQPKMISVPEWNREVLDLETTEAALLRGVEENQGADQQRPDGIRVDPIDAMQVDFVQKAARDVLGVEMNSGRKDQAQPATDTTTDARVQQATVERDEKEEVIPKATVEAQVTFPSEATVVNPISASPRFATDATDAQAETGPSHSALDFDDKPFSASLDRQHPSAWVEEDSDEESLPPLDLSRTDDEDEEQ